jgi:hypothetical protein
MLIHFGESLSPLFLGFSLLEGEFGLQVLFCFLNSDYWIHTRYSYVGWICHGWFDADTCPENLFFPCPLFPS